MNRNQRLKFVLKGDLAEALAWEATRQETNIQNLIEHFLEKSCSDLLALWKQDCADRKIRQVSARTTPVEAVLQMSYGPSEGSRKTRVRRPVARRLT